MQGINVKLDDFTILPISDHILISGEGGSSRA